MSFITQIPFSCLLSVGKPNPRRLTRLSFLAQPTRHLVDYFKPLFRFGLRSFVMALLVVSRFATKLLVAVPSFLRQNSIADCLENGATGLSLESDLPTNAIRRRETRVR